MLCTSPSGAPTAQHLLLPILGWGGVCWEQTGVRGLDPATPNNHLLSVGEEMQRAD